jgi:hypothetical protein
MKREELIALIQEKPEEINTEWQQKVEELM